MTGWLDEYGLAGANSLHCTVHVQHSSQLPHQQGAHQPA